MKASPKTTAARVRAPDREPQRVTISVYFDASLRRALKARARQLDVSYSRHIRALVRRDIADNAAA